MKTLLRLLLKTQHQRNRSVPPQTEKGMTLVELLIGAIMAFLIITPMLGFVVDMLNTDRREQVKSNTEQDIQAAVDFIAQDLSQAIHIYDNNPDTGIPELINKKYIPTGNDKTPILVFWKRQQLKKSVPINSTVSAKTPSDCNTKPDECNDYYVLSLVAYYQFKDSAPTWCQPLGVTCPTRIARYEIRDGVKNPSPADPTKPYYTLDPKEPGSPDPAFNTADFDINKPAEKVTMGGDKFKNPEVLVNYIDHSPGPTVTGNECTTALGNPSITTGVTTTPVPETTLRIPPTPPDTVNSFYACVDSARNIARVTIRGNSLRRLQADNAKYDPKISAFFPTASVQVQGLGARGK